MLVRAVAAHDGAVVHDRLLDVHVDRDGQGLVAHLDVLRVLVRRAHAGRGHGVRMRRPRSTAEAARPGPEPGVRLAPVPRGRRAALQRGALVQGGDCENWISRRRAAHAARHVRTDALGEDGGQRDVEREERGLLRRVRGARERQVEHVADRDNQEIADAVLEEDVADAADALLGEDVAHEPYRAEQAREEVVDLTEERVRSMKNDLFMRGEERVGNVLYVDMIMCRFFSCFFPSFRFRRRSSPTIDA